eukprot:gnl/TRDRNA2_/TRDRNA2_183215_c0_seq1.p1 gnl/TRDRNA2_/TRDRNA2_183215_c0~~gnl/TRDRNA2_/TRDRNA2_183215_c0_seq1.p1  ORF type:complete len:110 (+),score=22.24 gnl/TRDRNA2_/TRDRNA2_183215_c0_seq1:89-418(+)
MMLSLTRMLLAVLAIIAFVPNVQAVTLRRPSSAVHVTRHGHTEKDGAVFAADWDPWDSHIDNSTEDAWWYQLAGTWGFYLLVLLATPFLLTLNFHKKRTDQLFEEVDYI